MWDMIKSYQPHRDDPAVCQCCSYAAPPPYPCWVVRADECRYSRSRSKLKLMGPSHSDKLHCFVLHLYIWNWSCNWKVGGSNPKVGHGLEYLLESNVIRFDRFGISCNYFPTQKFIYALQMMMMHLLLYCHLSKDLRLFIFSLNTLASPGWFTC